MFAKLLAALYDIAKAAKIKRDNLDLFVVISANLGSIL